MASPPAAAAAAAAPAAAVGGGAGRPAAAAAAASAKPLPTAVTPTHPDRVEFASLLSQLFSGMDIDGDGQLSAEDFLVSTHTLNPQHLGDAAIRKQWAYVLETVPTRANPNTLTQTEYVNAHTSKLSALPDVMFARMLPQFRQSVADLHAALAPPNGALYKAKMTKLQQRAVVSGVNSDANPPAAAAAEATASPDA